MSHAVERSSFSEERALEEQAYVETRASGFTGRPQLRAARIKDNVPLGPRNQSPATPEDTTQAVSTEEKHLC